MTTLLSINIGIDPNITSLGGLLITWHGVFTAIGIVVGVWLAARLATASASASIPTRLTRSA
jgi:prolipoprotein diacylglyceryltransferase